ncbi:MAG: hypothetical protein QM757_34620 [Paludibaculum sp.]
MRPSWMQGGDSHSESQGEEAQAGYLERERIPGNGQDLRQETLQQEAGQDGDLEGLDRPERLTGP